MSALEDFTGQRTPVYRFTHPIFTVSQCRVREFIGYGTTDDDRCPVCGWKGTRDD